MKNKAFTLIELLVVIVIIGILATLTTATFSGSIEKANDVKRLSFMKNVYDEVERARFINESAWQGMIHIRTIMSSWGGAGSWDANESVQQIVERLFPGSLPGEDTCILVAYSVNSTQDTSGEDDQFLLLSWGAGSGEVQIVGSDYWKGEIEGNGWAEADFACAYASEAAAVASFDTIIPKMYPTGVTTPTEFAEFAIGPSTSSVFNRMAVQIIQENGDVCAFSDGNPFDPSPSGFTNCDDGY